MQAVFGTLLIGLIRLLGFLPLSLLYFFARIVAFILNTIYPYRKKVIDDNLLRCFPEKTVAERLAIRRDFYRFFSRMLMEAVKSYQISQQKLKQLVDVQLSDEVLHYLNNNQPLVIMMAHYGNWEVIGLSPDREDISFHSLYRQLKNKTINDFVVKNRQRFGLILLNEGQSLRELARKLGSKQPNFITFITDQAAHPSRACQVQFFNQETNFIKGPERLAKQFNCPVFFAHVAIENDKYVVTFKPISMKPQEAADNEIIQRFADYVEEMIRENPAFWLWSHRRWKYNEQTLK